MLLASSRPKLARRFAPWVCMLLAAIPVGYIAFVAAAASRNIVFWDEFDTALALILRIDAGAGWPELRQLFFAIDNEHRTVTSRVLYAASYWLTGTINFHVIGAIGNLFLVGACAALVLAVTGAERRIRMGVVLAFFMFQLEHFESFIWSGSSIDHFQVVMLVILAVAALARGTWAGCAVAAGFGLLATFTLAQGNVVWPLGALLLAHQRRWRELMVWCGCGGAVVAAFLHGFELNPGHRINGISAQTIAGIAYYWLKLLGAPLTLGEAAWAAWPGVGLLVALAWLLARGMATCQPVAMCTAVFAIGALALVALGRAELAGGLVNSRYLVLGALAWALVLFMLLELAVEADPARPFRALMWLLPFLMAFNFAADRKFLPMVGSFIEVRDRAATSFQQFGVDGREVTKLRLHPQEQHADALMKLAEERGVYRLPEFSRPATPPDATPSTRLITHVDELFSGPRAVTIGGWAMLPGRWSERGQIFVVLESEKSRLIFSTVSLQRSDVAAAYKEPKWRQSGFRAVINRGRLPAENFAVGVLVVDAGKAEYLMTANRLELGTSEGRAVRPVGAP